jgi:uncharacterized protein YkwD
MSFESLFPLPSVPSGARRVLKLCALHAIFIAALAAQASAQSSSARPTARLISSSGPVVTMPERAHAWTAPASAAPVRDRMVTAKPEPISMAVSSLERRAFELVNRERARSGEAPLVWDAELCRMAELHSQHMAQQNFFSHVGPDGLSMENRARALGISGWRAMGENIAYNRGIDDPAGFAVQRWMSSDGHRANILNGKFSRSAIGVARTPDGRIYLTQVFLAR